MLRGCAQYPDASEAYAQTSSSAYDVCRDPHPPLPFNVEEFKSRPSMERAVETMDGLEAANIQKHYNDVSSAQNRQACGGYLAIRLATQGFAAHWNPGPVVVEVWWFW